MTALPRGFRAHVANIGIKDDTTDFALVVGDEACAASAVFTQSRFAGPSVLLSRDHVANGSIRAVAVISKNANVAVGPDGHADALELARGVAKAVGCAPDEVLIASTGVIGRRYPIEKVRSHLAAGWTPDITEAEPNNEMLKPQSIALPAVLHGQFAKAGDVDSFAFKMKAGQTLVAAMDAYTAGVSMDALMLLRDARGVKLAFNHDAHSLDPRLTWKCPRDGTYVLQMACFKFPANSTSSFGGGTGLTYRVTLTNGPYLRHAWPSAISGGEALIALRGWNLVNDTARPRAQENDTELVLPIEAINGPLRLPVTGRPETVEREPNDANATANAFGLANISGRIDRSGDVDRFAFDAKKGGRA